MTRKGLYALKRTDEPTNKPFDLLTMCKQMSYVKLLVLNSNTWSHVTVHKQMMNRIIYVR